MPRWQHGSLAHLQTGRPVWRFEFRPAPALAERAINVKSVRARLQGVGTLLHVAPLVSAGGEISFLFLVATEADAEVFTGWADDGLTWAPYEPAPPPPAQPPAPEQGDASGADAKTARLLTPTITLRVDLTRLDELMQMVGDLVISRSRLDENLKRVETLLPAEPWCTLQETNQALERQLRNLREGVMRVRLVPIGEVFSRMQFMIRDLAREHGKKIAIALSGQETEIDKERARNNFPVFLRYDKGP